MIICDFCIISVIKSIVIVNVIWTNVALNIFDYV